MKLLEFIKQQSSSGLPVFAKECGTSLGYLRQVAWGHKIPNVTLAINIARLTGYEVSLSSLRPDINWVQWHQDIECDIKRAA
ncbi:YdaS family helix-turn-helix protein [Denitrificimonas caeni]|uniref:YdaS family helix-turn-helix protein n=1 Tax=Denitrificimonas caeni TaxID=521720 RepID=UPI001963612B|nr:YdaS family helix-turn-helix protein [Denitrificimonas caeni]